MACLSLTCTKSPLHGLPEPHLFQALSQRQVTGNRLAVALLAENGIQTHSFWAAPDYHQPDLNLDQPRCSRVRHHLPEERLPRRMSSLKTESSFNGQVKRKRKTEVGEANYSICVYAGTTPTPMQPGLCGPPRQLLILSPSSKGNPKISPTHTQPGLGAGAALLLPSIPTERVHLSDQVRNQDWGRGGTQKRWLGSLTHEHLLPALFEKRRSLEAGRQMEWLTS